MLNNQINKQSEQIKSQTNYIKIDRQTNRQIDQQTDRQIDKHTD